MPQLHFCNSVLWDIVYKKKYSENFGSRISAWARSNLVKIVYSRKNILRILGQELSLEGKVFFSFLENYLRIVIWGQSIYFLENFLIEPYRRFFLLLSILKRAIGILSPHFTWILSIKCFHELFDKSRLFICQCFSITFG